VWSLSAHQPSRFGFGWVERPSRLLALPKHALLSQPLICAASVWLLLWLLLWWWWWWWRRLMLLTLLQTAPCRAGALAMTHGTWRAIGRP